MNSTTKYIIGIIFFILLAVGMWYFRSLVTYVIIAVIISIIGRPLKELLDKVKIKKWQMNSGLSAILTIVVMIFALVIFVSIFAPMIAEQANNFAQLDVEKTAKSLEKPLENTEKWLQNFNLSDDDRSNREYIIDQLKQLIDFSKISSIFNNVFAVLTNTFIGVFSILFIAFFFLKDQNLFRKMIMALTPSKNTEQMKSIMGNSKKLLTRYFLGILAQVSIVTLLVSLGLTFFGVKNAFLIGFIAGLVNVVPYVGPIIGITIGLLLTISSNLDLSFQTELLPLLGKVLGVFVVVQLLDNFVTQPIVFSNSVHAHPLEIYLVIFASGYMFGVVGMIAAVPVYTLLRIVAKEFLSEFKFVRSLTQDL